MPWRSSARSEPEPEPATLPRDESGWGSLAPTQSGREPESGEALSAERGPDPAVPPTGAGAVEPGRYDSGPMLGKGGMGEVWACVDRRIGREVAMKVVRPGRGRADPSGARFLHEARVQARLEHPAIVPVYDLGVGPSGEAFFTMKRVRGRTLSEVLALLLAGVPEARARFGRRKLLGAFGQVCLAIDYAHAQGVVHRDLKPSNVMLGDFGEVYVLDWGLAKIRGDAETPPAARRPQTKLGQVLGTPGYMAPEQETGGPIDERTDVYALGAILWEIVTLERHGEGVTCGVGPSRRHEAPPSSASGNEPAPPELLDVAERALAADPDRRLGSARALWSAVERYLDGDRDLELRRARAEEHARAAATATVRAIEGDTEAHTARRRAMRELGQALALDPGHGEARRALVQLLVEPPARLPAEVARELEGTVRSADRAAGLFGSLAFLYILLVCPIGYLMGVRDSRMVTFWPLAIAVAAALRMVTVLRPALALRGVVLLVSAAAFSVLAGLFGPLLFLPGILAANTVSYALVPSRRLRLASIALAILSVVVPFGLELGGVIAPSYSFADGALIVRSHLVASLPAGPTTALLLLTSLGVLVLPVLFVGQTGRALAEAERRLALHAWHLRQLVPEAHDPGRSVPSSPSCDDDPPRSSGSCSR